MRMRIVLTTLVPILCVLTSHHRGCLVNMPSLPCRATFFLPPCLSGTRFAFSRGMAIIHA